MLISEAIALGLQLFRGVQNAVNNGQAEVSEEDLNAAVGEIAASDTRLTDAIARARAREAGE